MSLVQRQLLNDFEYEVFCNLVNMVPEHISVLTKIKLSEFITPSAEYGTDLFYREFAQLNKYTAPFVLYSLKDRTVISAMDLSLEGRLPALTDCKSWLNDANVTLITVRDLASLYTETSLTELFPME